MAKSRRGLGKGKGKGYRNIIGKDPTVHSQSAKGMKQPEKIRQATDILLNKSKIPIGFQIVNELDPLEQRTFLQQIKAGRTPEKALEVVINSVDGDTSQLSPALKEYAEKKGLINHEMGDVVSYKGKDWEIVNIEDDTYTLQDGKGNTEYMDVREHKKTSSKPKLHVGKITFKDFHIFAGGYPTKESAQKEAERIRKRDNVYARIKKLKSGYYVYITKFERNGD